MAARYSWFLALLLALLPRPSAAITFGQTDTFEDGTTDGWGDPAGNSSNIASGGPAGAGDHYMQVVSGSYGGSSHMVTFNDSEWLGNYTAAGVTEVTMQLLNGGSSAIPIRIAIREGSSGQFTPGYCTSPYYIPADGQWHLAIFFLTAGNLTPFNNPQPLSTDLANVGDFRILSAVNPQGIGDTISAEIGVADIRATGVPEPGALEVLGLAMTGLLIGRLRRIVPEGQATIAQRFSVGMPPTRIESRRDG